MGEKGREARTLFEQGYNCAQSVFGAFAEECGLDRETAVRLASPFGGGIGRMREVCGAVSGMMMAAGLLCGYSDPKAFDEKKRTYGTARELARRFQEENGSIVCRELLGAEGADTSAVPNRRTDGYYRKRPCAALVECAADILDRYLREQKEQSGGNGEEEGV